MKLDSKNLWRPALVITSVGFLAVLVYFSATNPKIRAIFASGTQTSSTAGEPAGHGAASHGAGGHAHGGDAPSVKTTLWAKQLDIFLERPYPVAGEAIDPLVHATVMVNGQAVTEGSMTFKATGPDGNVVKVVMEKPTRTGIFIPKVTFPEPGAYKTQLIFNTPQIKGNEETIELPEIIVYDSTSDALAAAKQAGDDGSADAISFLKEQQWRIGLITEPASEQELVERLVVPGRVIVPPGSGAIISPPIAGKVYPPQDKAFPRIGEKVEKGQVLAVIDPSVAGADAVQMVANNAQLQTLDADLAVKQMDVETKIRETELRLVRAKDICERKRKLTEEGITAGKELLLAEHEVSLAETELKGLKQVLQPYVEGRQRLAKVLGRVQSSDENGEQSDDLRVTLRSPIAGTLVEVGATSGELVTANHQLFKVVDIDTLWIEASISEYDLSRVQKIPGASYRLAAYPDHIVPIADGGGFIDIGAVVDPETRTVPIRYEVSNLDGTLRAGMFADLLVETNRRQTALAIPKSAVVDEGGEMVVYLQRGGETFERRRVEVGIRDANHVEICSGLAKGDRVATKGAYTIRLSTLSSAIPAHGHAH
jgi:multidrug efflux pump subunit AcrA (membrane-fusion protein)